MSSVTATALAQVSRLQDETVGLQDEIKGLEAQNKDAAAELVIRLMHSVIGALKEDKAFRSRYNPDQEGGVGGRGYIDGAAPLSLFLQTLGVRLISPSKVWIQPGNPYPWPVTVRWRGLVVHCEQEKTRVTFPDGQETMVRGAEAQIVEQVLGPAQDPEPEGSDSVEDDGEVQSGRTTEEVK